MADREAGGGVFARLPMRPRRTPRVKTVPLFYNEERLHQALGIEAAAIYH